MTANSRNIMIKPLTAELFSGYGDVIETEGADNFEINGGLCTRYHDLANIEFSGPKGRPMISLLVGKPYGLPLNLPMVERHPLGSQAFIPLSDNPFLVIVCDDHDGVPGAPKAFITSKRQGINIAQNVWHGVLTPLEEDSSFAVVDRAGDGNNLEEYFFEESYVVNM